MMTNDVSQGRLRPVGNSVRKPWSMAVATVRFVLSLLVASCSGSESSAVFTEAQRHEADSVVKSCAGIDSLKVLLGSFERDDNALGVIVCCRELGKRYRNDSKFDNALKMCEKGLKWAEQAADTLEIVQALNNIGTNYRRLGLLDLASEYHYKALNIAMSYSDSLNEQAMKNHVVSLNGLGNIYLTLGDQQMADSVFRAALAGERRLGSALGQAINYANLGSIFEKQGQTDSAWAYYRKSMELNTEAGSDLGVSLCHNHYGELYENDHRYDDALREYAKSYDMMKESDDSWHWLESCISMARVYVAKGNYATAADYLDRALSVAGNIKSLEHEGQIHHLYYQIFSQRGDATRALSHFVKAKACDDSVVNLRKVNEIQNLRLNIERGRQEQRFSLVQKNLKLERESKHVAWFALVVVLLLALLSIAFIWYALRTRIRTVKILREMQDIRENFFTNVTHEFRTPLTVILGEARLLKDGTLRDDSKIETAATMIERQGNSLLNLINQLLDISKARSAIGQADWRCGNVVAYISMLVESYADFARQKQLALSYTPAENDVQMDFVPAYMNKILRNLLSNAFKYTAEGGSIEVSSRVQGSNLELKVADTGVGIDSKVLPHVFEAFFQGADGHQNVGTGVGLALVKDIVEAMDGQIGVNSQLGKGTTFSIRLPLRHGSAHLQPVDMGAENLEPIAPDGSAEPLPDMPYYASDDDDEGSTATQLLIVEDNSDVACYIGQQLREKYNIAYAHDGEEGLKKALEMVPDLIVTDLMMPGINGYELCARIRRSELLCHVPVIMVTARCTDDDRIRGLEAGVDAYLYKPFNSEELNVRVEKLLDQRRMLREKFSQAIKDDAKTEEKIQPIVADAFVKRLDDAIMQLMPSGNANLQGVADKMCLSPSQLRRKLYATTGETPANYITLVRMRHARRLLDTRKELSVGEVATICGYDDNSHFTRVFRQVYDITPTDYRKREKYEIRHND